MISQIAKFLSQPAVQNLSRDGLLKLDPEIAHQLTIKAIKLGAVAPQENKDPDFFKTEIAGLSLKNPIGMAAGLDKNAEVSNQLSDIGFGFAEVGTITPRPQDGNPKPRLFRVPQAQGIINRMGFNNEGHLVAYERLTNNKQAGVTIGVNVGANKDSDDFVADYVEGVTRFAPIADYLTVNISSPNTPGLRDLQSGEALKRLLGEALNARAKDCVRVPVFLKLAPDLNEAEMDEVVSVIKQVDLDGLIISNTTLSRDQVAGLPNADEAGGLSGKPLFNFSTMRLAQMRMRVGGDMPIVGVGGIHSAQSAIAKLAAGANAIQLYSALVFGGMELLRDIKDGMAVKVRKDKLQSVGQLTSTDVESWASGKAQL
ncbi:quinone-dependent dihydroorotate dehydrogenase [uncultured Maritalea sp.]|uniref:quinone-dependent dihydroorotate dehydrogenase n=1 Tax=uncultured Maritalea sp. TaxID=757249 RepID=UPI00262C54A3|nr:quinone-dependent dihydroorotate dehydrogenase [uncultured Maritalea sp.]